MSWLTPDEDDDDTPFGEYDESAAKVRPNRRGTRPRTKRRPEHETAVPARVVQVDRGRFTVLVDEDGADEHQATATRARELGRSPIVVGDAVDLVGDVTGDEGSLSRIVRVQERSTLLRRSADDTDAVERVIVANADQLLVVVAAADPEPRPRLVDRYLVAAFDAGLEPILVITKSDLTDPAPFLEEFAALDLEIVLSGEGDRPVEQLRSRLAGHRTVAVGHSGVGKSTLVNALVPGARRAIGVVNEVTGRGRHTSSSSIALRMHDADGRAGWIIDTPGVRSFGLGHVRPADVLRRFVEHAVPTEGAPPDGVALRDAHDWEIVDRVGDGELGESGRRRLESLTAILGTLAERPY